MEKKEVLELLQDKARELAELEKWLNSNGEKRLAEYACVWRLVNFKIQDIIAATAQNKLDEAFCALHADLCAGMENARDNQITALHELYGAALDCFSKLRGLISFYLP
jgi:hypothetical protein